MQVQTHLPSASHAPLVVFVVTSPAGVEAESAGGGGDADDDVCGGGGDADDDVCGGGGDATVGQDDIVGCVDKGTGVSLPTTRSRGKLARL